MKSSTAMAIGIACIATSACGSSASSQSSATGSSVSPDEIAVYEVVLSSWLGQEKGRQLVNKQLSAPPSKSDAEFKECANGLDFSGAPHAVQAKKSLTGVQLKGKGIELIDRSQWRPADPEEGIENGKSVEAAVREGFSKSLISLSQIAFTRDGQDALVKFGMVCGSLCGSGSTIHLHKSAKGWSILGRCGEWMS
jgi:hypothetical protein